jgi:hypothetical protein
MGVFPMACKISSYTRRDSEKDKPGEDMVFCSIINEVERIFKVIEGGRPLTAEFSSTYQAPLGRLNYFD